MIPKASRVKMVLIIFKTCNERTLHMGIQVRLVRYELGDAATEMGQRFTVTQQTLFLTIIEMANSLYEPTMEGIQAATISTS